jgi:hypothetical protein
MKSFEFGSSSARALAATGAAVGALVLATPIEGSSVASQHKPSGTGEACHFDEKKDVTPFSGHRSNNKNFCIEAVYPMGQSEVINDSDSGEIGLIGLKIKVAGIEYVCVVPATQPNADDQPQVRGEAFSLRNSCIPEPNPHHAIK